MANHLNIIKLFNCSIQKTAENTVLNVSILHMKLSQSVCYDLGICGTNVCPVKDESSIHQRINQQYFGFKDLDYKAS